MRGRTREYKSHLRDISQEFMTKYLYLLSKGSRLPIINCVAALTAGGICCGRHDVKEHWVRYLICLHTCDQVKMKSVCVLAEFNEVPKIYHLYIIPPMIIPTHPASHLPLL